ncbi:hypothetical protein JD844_006180 [Phrynosoma platyrhinos]|uniref:Uncharacterized protein n=1 Tax=Phrynosoma platyrhinos TaxID=52577 RepID=A0ABQ7T1Q3_PHRPL|nr:hypothetical protein JD844_006180 [Phrynosoma platyrhinos]
MYLQAFFIVVLSTVLVKTTDPDQCRCEDKVNACIIRDGSPGANGLPGRDGLPGPKGEKGEQGDQVLAMYVLQLLKALVLGASLALATVSETNRCESSTCTVMACGNPGLNGLPGRDGKDGAKGEKGDPAIGTIQTQVAALEKMIQTLQEDLRKMKT